MTLVVAVTGPESIWLVADRRLSYEGHPPKDDARKVMFLDTTDGVAILSYAGLGATALGTEPADCMSAVLRGRNLLLEQSLRVLAEATRHQLPQHLIRMPGDTGPAHHVIVPALLGEEPRLYTIDLVFTHDRKDYNFRYTRHVVDKPSTAKPRTPWLGVGGSGALHLAKDKKWMRSLLRVVRANDRGRVPQRAVADHLANLNHDVHLRVTDESVGPRCIVAWRHRTGGGGHQFYTGSTPDASSPSLPTISNGMDLRAFVDVVGPPSMKSLMARLAGESAREPDVGEINAALARLPDKPDEDLR